MSILKSLREKRNINQSKLAELLGISNPNYSKKENGQVKFSLEEAKIIADYFEMKLEDIFFADDFSNNEHSNA